MNDFHHHSGPKITTQSLLYQLKVVQHNKFINLLSTIFLPSFHLSCTFVWMKQIPSFCLNLSIYIYPLTKFWQLRSLAKEDGQNCQLAGKSSNSYWWSDNIFVEKAAKKNQEKIFFISLSLPPFLPYLGNLLTLWIAHDFLPIFSPSSPTSSSVWLISSNKTLRFPP